MAGDSNNQGAYAHLVTKIVANYVANHIVPPSDIPGLIGIIHRSFAELGRPAEAAAPLSPAVPLRRSVQRDAVTCLDCGWRGKMLRRHLGTRHGLTGDEYLRRWGLPSDHPLTAPMYSQQRSALAKELGLGRGRTAERRGRPRRGG